MEKLKLIQILARLLQEVSEMPENSLRLDKNPIRLRQYDRITFDNNKLKIIDIVIDVTEVV